MRLARRRRRHGWKMAAFPLEAFDFANLTRDGGRFGAEALAAMGAVPMLTSPAPASLTADHRPASDAPKPTEIGANIAVPHPGRAPTRHPPGPRLDGVAGSRPAWPMRGDLRRLFHGHGGDAATRSCCFRAAKSAGGAVMKSDAAGRWAWRGGSPRAACGPACPTCAPGALLWPAPAPLKDMDIGGMRLSVVPSAQAARLLDPSRYRAAKMSSVALIDYGSGNLASAAKALARASADTGHEIIVTAIPNCKEPSASCCRASALRPIACAAWPPCRAWSMLREKS